MSALQLQFTFVTPAGVSISVIFLPAPGGFFKPDRGGGGGGVPFAPEGGSGGGGGLFMPVQSADSVPLMHAVQTTHKRAMHRYMVKMPTSTYSSATSIQSE